MKTIYTLSILLISFSNVCNSQPNNFLNLKNSPKSIKIKKIYNRTLYTKVYNFDKGQLIKKISKRNFIKRDKIKYQYNFNGNLIKEISTNPKKKKDTIVSEYKYYYNDKGQIIKVIFKYNDEITRIKDSIIYNDESNVVSYIILRPKTLNHYYYLKEYHNITYNNKGLINTYIIKDNNSGFLKHQYYYNRLGDILEVITTQQISIDAPKIEDKVNRYSYKYDKYNNWKKRYVSIQGKIKRDTKRKIKY